MQVATSLTSQSSGTFTWLKESNIVVLRQGYLWQSFDQLVLHCKSHPKHQWKPGQTAPSIATEAPSESIGKARVTLASKHKQAQLASMGPCSKTSKQLYCEWVFSPYTFVANKPAVQARLFNATTRLYLARFVFKGKTLGRNILCKGYVAKNTSRTWLNIFDQFDPEKMRKELGGSGSRHRCFVIFRHSQCLRWVQLVNFLRITAWH